MSEFTGERLVPGEVDADLWNEHISRYAFAASLTGGRARVIDAGCGTGYGTRLLAARGTQVFGIDISTDAIAFAVRQYASRHVRFLAGSVESLPVLGGCADVVIAFEVIEHLALWRDFLSESRRVLAPGGLLIVSTPNRRFYTESRGEAGPNPFHVHEFDLHEFSDALSQQFAHVRIFGQNHTGVIAFTTQGEPLSAVYRESLHTDTESAAFFLAVCSPEPLPELAGFFYVPSTANLLRERERHIQLLASEVAEKNGELEALHLLQAAAVERSRFEKAELERSNRWAEELDRESRERGARIEALQAELEQAHSWAAGLEMESAGRGLRIVDLQSELWSAQQHARAAIDRLEGELAANAQSAQTALDALHVTLEERTGWAQQLDAEVQTLRNAVADLEGTVAAYRASRWTRIGKTLHVGPLARE